MIGETNIVKRGSFLICVRFKERGEGLIEKGPDVFMNYVQRKFIVFENKTCKILKFRVYVFPVGAYGVASEKECFNSISLELFRDKGEETCA